MPARLLSNELTLDYQAVERRIFQAAERGLRMSLEQLADSAKAKAPVRDVFIHPGRRESPEKVPRGIQRRRRWTHQTKAFGRRITHHTERGRARLKRQAAAQDMKPDRFAIGVTPGGRPIMVARSPRTLIPAFRTGENEITTGPFRTLRAKQGGFRLAAVTELIVNRGRSVTAHKGVTGQRFLKGDTTRDQGPDLRWANKRLARASEEQVKDFVRKSSISYRRAQGETDLGITRKIGRRQSAIHVGASGEDFTLGGRLRDEIFVGPIVNEGGLIYGDVISPTEYGKYQEYGTSRHRPQPYMRPALYGMRRRFADNVRRSVGRNL